MSFITENPLLGIILISAAVTLVITLVYKFFTNQEKIKNLKDETKAIQKEIKENKDNPEKAMELQKKAFEKSIEQFKHTMTPMLITLVPIFILFAWLRRTLPESEIILNLPFNLPKIGANEGFGWLGIYIITSMILNPILRKLFKVH